MGTTLNGYALISIDGVKKISKREIDYQPPIEINPPYLGTPITESVAKVLINNFRKDPTHIANSIVIALDYGCNDLKTILIQENCKAIRFYLAKRYNGDFEISTRLGDGVTLVAIGIDENGVEITTNNNIGDFNNNISGSQNINDFPEDTIPVQQNGIIFEMVPPLTATRDIAKALVSKISFENAMKKHFGFR